MNAPYRGGQGRSDADIEDDGGGLFVLLAIVFIAWLGIAAWWWIGGAS